MDNGNNYVEESYIVVRSSNGENIAGDNLTFSIDEKENAVYVDDRETSVFPEKKMVVNSDNCSRYFPGDIESLIHDIHEHGTGCSL